MGTRELLRYLLPLAALQAVFVVFIPPLFEPDSASYVTAARQLLDSAAFFMPSRPPGYPAFLAAIYSLTGGSDLAVMLAPVQKRTVFAGIGCTV